MKTLKITLIIIAIVIGLGGALTWYLAENLDAMVKNAVEETGTRQLGTSVGLASVSIDIPRGKAKLAGLRIENPPGFSSEPAFVLGSIEVDIDLTSMTDDVLVIEDITINDPQVNFELNREGVSNLDVLQQKLGGNGASSASEDSKRLIIERIEFSGGTITATAAIRPDDQLAFDFPVVFMTDLGRPGGATAEEIGAEISAVLLERSMSAAKRAGVQQLLDRQKEKLVEKAEEKLEEKLRDLLKRD